MSRKWSQSQEGKSSTFDYLFSSECWEALKLPQRSHECTWLPGKGIKPILCILTTFWGLFVHVNFVVRWFKSWQNVNKIVFKPLLQDSGQEQGTTFCQYGSYFMFNLDVGGKLDVRLHEKSIYMKKETKKPISTKRNNELKIDVCLNLKKSFLISKLW